ncbi:MAG: flagellin-like protein [Candidatus Nanohaloarchaea archaeon]|jgi:flagellin-like protein
MKRKGITPVIAVVLLLLITVGAVASAYGLYQSIISDQSQIDQLNAQQRASQTDFAYSSVVENSTSGSTQIYLQNTGSRAVNLSSEVELLLSPDGEQGYVSHLVIENQYSEWDAGDNNCFESGAGLLETGNTYSCDTGASFPNATQELGIQVNYRNADNVDWTYRCRPETSGTSTC